MNSLKTLAKLAPRLTSRNISTGKQRLTVSMKQSYGEGTSKGVCPTNEGYEKVRLMQVEMNATEDLMAWQKRGGRDTIPSAMTMALCAGATLYCFAIIWNMSFPPKNQ